MYRLRFFASVTSLIFASVCSLCIVPATGQQKSESNLDPDSAATLALRHGTAEWQIVAPHLPDPKNASPALLQQAGDILRARRFLEDALEYYRYAISRGGDEALLDNRMGVTELQLDQPALARIYFRRCVALKKKDAEGWNNLGAVETIDGNARQAISDYQRAVKINRQNGLFHANLGTAYLAIKDSGSAGREFEMAVKLDPAVFERGGFGGSLVHVLSAADRGQFAFEMARLAAAHNEEEGMLHWLEKASEAGFDLHVAISGAREFLPYLDDARIAIIVRNTQALRNKEVAVTGPVPVLQGIGTAPR